jgi:endonuclease/exonuclease/phosphatase family metal-dependent hydrolase
VTSGRLASLAFAFLAALAPAPAAAASGDTLTVVTLNLWHDQQDWPRRRALIVDELRALRPDVVCLQEVLQHETLPNQAYALAESLGFDVAFSSTDRESSPKRYGNAILSRHPIVERSWKPLAPLNDYRTVVHVRIDVHGVPLDVFDTHLHHTAEGAAIRAEQVRDLLAYVKAHRGPGPVVLAGDFNAAPTVPELQEVKKGFADAFAVGRGAVADTNTTLNPHKGHAPRRIDYVFLSRDGRPSLRPLASERVFDVPGADGTWPSDHFGVVARILVVGSR